MKRGLAMSDGSAESWKGYAFDPLLDLGIKLMHSLALGR